MRYLVGVTFYALRSGPYSPNLAYVAGVILGDACCYRAGSTWRVELKVRDREFAEEFAGAMARTVKRPEARRPHVIEQTDRGTAEYRVTVAARHFGDWWQRCEADLRELLPVVERCPAPFLRGLYDSEGSLGRVARIGMTRREALELGQHALKLLGMEGGLRVDRPAGTALTLPNGERHVTRSDLWVLTPRPTVEFLEVVGSSIPRKAGWSERGKCERCDGDMPIRPGRKSRFCSRSCAALAREEARRSA